MKAGDFLSERMVFGVFIIVGYLLLVGSTANLPLANTTAHDVVVGAMGTLGAAVGMVVQSVFRTDKADKTAQDSINKLVTAGTGSGTGGAA